MTKSARLAASAVIVAGCAAAMPAHAAFVTFAGASGSLAAAVTFSQSAPGAPLAVQLTNTSTSDVLVPTDVLTGVFFTLAGSPALTRTSAVLPTGSVVVYDADGQPAGGVVGGEWAYKAGLSGAPGGAQAGLSSSGLGLFGPPDLFPGSDLAPPTSPDGLQYGILSAGDNTATGNAGVTGSGGLIKNSVFFTLGTAPGYTLASTSVSAVSFQYGTALNEPNVVAAVPAPESGALLGAGLLVLTGFANGRRKHD